RDAPQRLDADLPAGVLDEVLACEPVAAVDEHRIRAAHPVSTRAPERQGAIAIPLDLVQQVKDAVGWLGFEREHLPVRLVVELGVVAADAELNLHGSQ